MGNYLYNGVELPELPEWDKTAYPYAYIVDNTAVVTGYVLFVHGAQSTAKTDGTLFRYGAKMYVPSDNGWTLHTSSLTVNGKVVWANADVYDTDGNLYLAASDPVDPNATTAPLDPKSMLMGWIVGRRIAGQRK